MTGESAYHGGMLFLHRVALLPMYFEKLLWHFSSLGLHYIYKSEDFVLINSQVKEVEFIKKLTTLKILRPFINSSCIQRINQTCDLSAQE